MRDKLIKHRKIIPMLLVIYLSLYFIGIILIDILNVFNVQRFMIWYGQQGSYYRHEVPLFWYALNPHGSLTELVQWFFLFISLVTLWQLMNTTKTTNNPNRKWFKVWFGGLVIGC